MFDTIVAISSGFINQPISIIRLSGPDAFLITKNFFSGKVGDNKTITYGYIKDKDEVIDEVLVAWFKGPHSFTGEDIVEINAHGGVVNSNRILKLALINGARMAENGEFSRRAFLNGKINLVKAEAIHDLIFAQTEEQAKISVKKFDGKTTQLIDFLKTKLLNLISIIEINIDYPEYEDIKQLSREKLLPKLRELQKDFREIILASKSSRFIYQGINVVILGKPNAGKSSLFNALLNEQKSIVTNLSGTTRDVIEGSVQIGQVLLNFKDTAGIHFTKDKIEQLGIQKALDQIKNADLIIHVIDGSKDNINDEEIEILSKNKLCVKVFNKSDIHSLKKGINISAKNNDIDSLIAYIKSIYQKIDLNNEKIIYNTRQFSLIESAQKLINEAIFSLENGHTPDTVIIDIQKAWEDLGNILGKTTQSDLLDLMFKNFCLGK